jgi:hypothetical protein
MIPIYNMFVPQGTTFTLTITFVARNLTSYTAHMQGRTEFGAATTAWSWSTSNGYLSIAAATDSILTITATATQTAALTAGEGVYDLQLTSPGGVVDRPLQGTYTIDARVTQ